MPVVFPPGLINLVNNDIGYVRDHILKQLHITEHIDGYTFDHNVSTDPDYLKHWRLSEGRLLVERNFQELNNRQAFDVVIFVKDAMAAIEYNKFGPHGFTCSILNLTWMKLGFFS